ncbi:UNVERIFIED_CONTAM: hypothetical protein Sradi_7253800 [Sesamum radiatum]|uniref:Uncharacterized protein n=1 Tax=Sesamum radiatum TaxID=300843 RepID=A0AAW2ILR0_SESRA
MSKTDFKDRMPVWQRVNTVYTPLAVPITKTLMVVKGKSLLSRSRSYKDGPQSPESDKFCRFHNDYGTQLQSEKASGTGPYLKYETNRDKNIKNPNLGSPVKNICGPSITGKAEINDPSGKGVIRMIVGGPVGGDSHRAKKALIQEAYGASAREVMDVEPANDALLI